MDELFIANVAHNDGESETNIFPIPNTPNTGDAFVHGYSGYVLRRAECGHHVIHLFKSDEFPSYTMCREYFEKRQGLIFSYWVANAGSMN